MRKTFLLTTLSLLYSLSACSQFEYFGSPSDLKAQLKKAQKDTTKAHLYVRLSNSYVFSHPDTALQYAQQGLRLAQSINDQKWIGYNSLSLAQSFIVMGNYPTAIEVALNVLPLFEKRSDTIGIIYSNLMLSWAQGDAGDAGRALPYAKNAKQFAEAIKDSLSLQIAFQHLAGEYEELNELDSAIFYGKKLLQIQDKYPELNGWVGFYRVIALAYRKKKQYDLALHYHRMTIEPSIKIGFLVDVVDAYEGIAKVYQEMKNIDSSTFYAYKVLHEYTRLPKLDARFKAAIILAENYQLSKNVDSALKYTRLSMAFNDSLSSHEKAKAIQNVFFNQQFRQQKLQQQEAEYRNNIKTSVLISGLVILLLITGMLYRNNQHKKKANGLLQKQKLIIEQTLQELKSTQAQLIQSEKMASLGELTAGIAHEIQNPLNFVNNFSEVNTELINELKEEADKGNYEEVKALANDIDENEQKIIHHGKRADSIVKGMLQHSRAGTGKKEPTNINALVDESLRLSYHGLRAKDKDFNATINTNFDDNIGKINIVPQDISRVLLNLFNNAFYAVNEKKGKLNGMYEPVVSVSTENENSCITITVQDNGNGIPQNILDKIFQPFFTTKPTGQGTGLGLSLSYDIIKAHGGEIKLESKEGEGSAFVVALPCK